MQAVRRLPFLDYWFFPDLRHGMSRFADLGLQGSYLYNRCYMPCLYCQHFFSSSSGALLCDLDLTCGIFQESFFSHNVVDNDFVPCGVICSNWKSVEWNYKKNDNNLQLLLDI